MARVSGVSAAAAAAAPRPTAVIGAAARGRLAALGRQALAVIDPVLYSYSQILFTTSRPAGLLLLAASLVTPRIGLFGLGAALLSFVVVKAAGFSPDLAARGVYGYNPLLVGLACGAFLAPSAGAVGLAAVAVVTVVFLQTALESAMGAVFNLPVLSLPFVLVALLALAAARLLPVDGVTPYAAGAALAPGLATRYLEALGAVFFQPALATGALVFAALLVYSRIAVLLSVVGFAVATLVSSQALFAAPAGPAIMAVNAMLVAVALGGVWFVPRVSSFALAAGAALCVSFVTLGLFIALSPLGLPALILPFNLGVLGGLHAMRQRVRDGAPKAVDFAAGAPEANLNYYRTRVARFGAAFAVRFALPFSGRWQVTQGVNGAHTHRGPWRHALDFEVQGADGKPHAGGGTALEHYHCYRLPVLAPADGTVVKVKDGVADNAPGKRNPADNWGNAVVIQHGIGLYSLVAHLAPGSVEVTEGRFVRAGTRLGLCGNSGRSFVPHLHFQLQASARLGAPTLALELHDVVVEEEAGPRLAGVHLPALGERVRNLERDEDLTPPFAFPLGSTWRFALEEGRAEREEVIHSHIDLYGALYLENDRGGRLFYESAGRQFLVYDYVGRRESALYMLYAAAPRVPYEARAELAWSDVLARRHFRPRFASWLIDLVDAFVPLDGERMRYRLERRADGLLVEGEGWIAGRRAATSVRLSHERGPEQIQLRLDGRAHAARLLEVRHEG